MVVLSESDLDCNDHGDHYDDVNFDDADPADHDHHDNHNLILMTCEKVVQALITLHCSPSVVSESGLGLKGDDIDINNDDDDDDYVDGIIKIAVEWPVMVMVMVMVICV